MAITWRNVDAPDFSAANRLSQVAGNTITQGLDSLAGLANQQADEMQDASTQTLLDKIYALQSVDDVDTALRSGEFDAATLQEQYGIKGADLSKVRDALMQRDNDIMQEETAKYEYENTLTARADKPLLDQTYARIIGETDVANLDKMKESIADSGLSAAGQYTVLSELAKRSNELTTQGRETKKWGWEVEDRDIEKKTKNAQLAAASQNLLNAKQEYLQDADIHAQTMMDNDRKNRDNFVMDYKPKERKELSDKLSAEKARAESLLGRFKVPEDIDDVMSNKSGVDALTEYTSALDKEKYDVTEIKDDLLNQLKGRVFQGTYTNPDNKEVTEEYTLDSLPYWVVKQALGEMSDVDLGYVFNGSILNTDTGIRIDVGAGDTSQGQLNDFRNAINRKIEVWLKTRNNLEIRDKIATESAAIQTDIQGKDLALTMEAIDVYNNSKRKNKNI